MSVDVTEAPATIASPNTASIGASPHSNVAAGLGAILLGTDRASDPQVGPTSEPPAMPSPLDAPFWPEIEVVVPAPRRSDVDVPTLPPLPLDESPAAISPAEPRFPVTPTWRASPSVGDRGVPHPSEGRAAPLRAAVAAPTADERVHIEVGRTQVEGEVSPGLRNTLLFLSFATAISARASPSLMIGSVLGYLVIVLIGALPMALVILGVARWLWRWDISYRAAFRLHAVAIAISLLPARLWLANFPGDAVFHSTRVFAIEATSNLIVPLIVLGGSSCIGGERLGWRKGAQLWAILLPFGGAWGFLWFLFVEAPKL